MRMVVVSVCRAVRDYIKDHGLGGHVYEPRVNEWYRSSARTRRRGEWRLVPACPGYLFYPYSILPAPLEAHVLRESGGDAPAIVAREVLEEINETLRVTRKRTDLTEHRQQECREQRAGPLPAGTRVAGTGIMSGMKGVVEEVRDDRMLVRFDNSTLRMWLLSGHVGTAGVVSA